MKLHTEKPPNATHCLAKPFHSSCYDPSRADAKVNDPTITRCINFAKSWGYGKLEVVNLFAYRTPHPSLLKQAAEPIGRDNNRYIIESVEKCDRLHKQQFS